MNGLFTSGRHESANGFIATKRIGTRGESLGCHVAVFAARYTDAWLKHGWVYHSLDHLYEQDSFDWDTEPPVALVDPAPYARSRYPNALNAGHRLFEGLAAIIGPQAVPDTMAEIYLQHAPLGSVTTEEVERQFYCLNGQEPDVRRAFWRYVYGFDGEPEPPPADYCD
jgi:hypothetical protein